MDQKQVWEGIAESWNRYRQKPWKEVIDFSKNRKFLLDLACGSGRHFLQGKKYIGIDFSKKMLRLAKQKAKKKKIDATLICADLSALPLKSSKFENILLVASLHLLSSNKKRTCLGETRRVMKKNDHALITVWNKEQPRFTGKKKIIFAPWKIGNKKYMRYYYLFTKDELKNLLDEYFEVEYVESQRRLKPFGENIIAIVRKI